MLRRAALLLASSPLTSSSAAWTASVPRLAPQASRLALCSSPALPARLERFSFHSSPRALRADQTDQRLRGLENLEKLDAKTNAQTAAGSSSSSAAASTVDSSPFAASAAATAAASSATARGSVLGAGAGAAAAAAAAAATATKTTYAYARRFNMKISPQKLNDILRLVRRLPVQTALAQLLLMRKTKARKVHLILREAISNASNNHGLDPTRLIVDECWVGKGVILKRAIFHAKGRSGVLHRRYAHLTFKLREVPLAELTTSRRFWKPALPRKETVRTWAERLKQEGPMQDRPPVHQRLKEFFRQRRKKQVHAQAGGQQQQQASGNES